MTTEQSRAVLNKFYDDVYRSDHKYTGADLAWELAVEHYPNFVKALDVGCGNGQMIRQLRELEKPCDVWGVDIARSLKDIWIEKGIREYCKIAPARELPFKDNSFDYVVCFNTLEHIMEWDINESFKEMARVGSKEFFFIITTCPEILPTNGYDSHICIKPLDWWIEKANQFITITKGVAFEAPGISFTFCEMRGALKS